MPIRKTGMTKCLHHKQKDVIFYCATCTNLICATCGISNRYCKQHDLHDIADVAVAKTEVIRTFVDNVEKQKLPNLKVEIKSIDEKLEENSKLFQDLCKKMKVQANKCKAEIDNLTSEFVTHCGSIENSNAALLRDYQNELTRIHDSLVQKANGCKKTLQNGTRVQIFDAADDLPDLENEIMPTVPEMETAAFDPQEMVSGLLKRALGLRETMYKLLDEPFILTRFTLRDKVPALLGLFPSEREHAWVACRNNSFLVDSNGNTVRELSVDMVNMAIAPQTGHIWFTSVTENVFTVHELSLSSGSQTTKFKLNDKPRRLCITRRNQIIIGTNDKIVLCTTSGRVLRTSMNTAVVNPWKIVECPVTGNIAIGNDETETGEDENNSKCHVIVFDQDLIVRFIYRGEDIDGAKKTTFAPGSLVYDNMGNLVIADYNRNTIELVSGSGSYIRRIHTAKGYWQGNLGMQPGDVLWALQLSETDQDEILRIKYYTN